MRHILLLSSYRLYIPYPPWCVNLAYCFSHISKITTSFCVCKCKEKIRGNQAFIIHTVPINIVGIALLFCINSTSPTHFLWNTLYTSKKKTSGLLSHGTVTDSLTLDTTYSLDSLVGICTIHLDMC